MKHTIKLSAIKAIVIQPAAGGQGVEFLLNMFRATVGGFTLSNADARFTGQKIKEAIENGTESEVHLAGGRVLDILPATCGGKWAELHIAGLGFIDFTPDQCGVLILAIECAINPVFAHKCVNKTIDGQGVKCQGGDCAAGQKAFPSPEFCGVTA